MTRDGTVPMPEPPAWMRLGLEALQMTWEEGQNAPPMNAETRAAVALLVRPVAL